VKKWIGGSVLADDRVIKQIPFVVFLAFLAVLLITNRNWSERTIRKVEVLQETLDELRSESITLSAKLMNSSRPSEIVKKVENAHIDLQEASRPPQKLVVKKNKLSWKFVK
jgi:hypothetical protein